MIKRTKRGYPVVYEYTRSDPRLFMTRTVYYPTEKAARAGMKRAEQRGKATSMSWRVV